MRKALKFILLGIGAILLFLWGANWDALLTHLGWNQLLVSKWPKIINIINSTYVLVAATSLISVAVGFWLSELLASYMPFAISYQKTGLTVQFNHGNQLPTQIHNDNVFRWYALCYVTNIVSPQGVAESGRFWTLFVTFDKPIKIKQILISTDNGAALPLHSINDQTPRSAIIAFDGDLAGLTLKMEVTQLD